MLSSHSPEAAEPLLSRFSIAFTRPTFQRVLVLFVGLVPAPARRTVAGALRAARAVAAGHHAACHRVCPRARCPHRVLGRALAAAVLEPVPPGEPAACPVDDTTPPRKGKQVWGDGRHRDDCRSTRSHTVRVVGHKWVVPAADVRFAFASRPRALPVRVAPYRSRESDEAEGRRHKAPIDPARQLLAALLRWFPGRRFILLGDGGYASHEPARFCHRRRRRVTPAALFHPQANLYDPPPARREGVPGRPRVKGDKRPAPREVVATAKRKRAAVSWYGGKRRRVEFVSEAGHWYKAGGGLVPARWVFAHDRDGTREDRHFCCTDPSPSPSRIIGLHTGRWSIEVTCQESRAHPGLATTRSWARTSVLRAGPCLPGLFGVVSLVFHHATHGGGRPAEPRTTPWYAKADVTFSDAITTVRRLLWQETILNGAANHEAFQKLPPPLRETLLDHLSLAA